MAESALHSYTVCKSSAWMEQKVGVMQMAAATLTDADNLIAELVSMDKAKNNNAENNL